MSTNNLQIRSLTPLYLVNFIGTLGFSIVLPFLVVMVLKFGGNEFVYGILGATYSFFQFVGAPILGSWSDKIGRRKVLIISQVGTFSAWVVFLIALLIPQNVVTNINSQLIGAFVVSVPLVLLFFARALDGLTGGNISVANAYLVDITPEGDRSKYFGKMSVAGNLGFMIGPALAGILGSTILGNILPIILAMLISLIAIMVITFGLENAPECKKLSVPVSLDRTRKILGQEHKECHPMEGQEQYSLADILRLKNVPFLLTQYFLIFLAFNFFYVAFPVHAITTLDWTVFDLGLFFSALSLVMIVFQGPVLGKASQYFTDGTLVTFGGVLLATGFFLFTYSQISVIALGTVMFAAGNGIMWPSFLSLISKVANQKYQGALQGFASSAGSLASILGLLTGSVLYSQINTYIFIIPAMIMVLIVMTFIKKRGFRIAT